jgi:hypothetical protein
MLTALLIAIHARFVRDMAHLPEGIDVILCSGPEGATRDFDDFSTTEHLIALGRAEASEIVRRYGLGTIPYPAPPLAVPDLDGEGDAGGVISDEPSTDPAPGPGSRPVPGDHGTGNGRLPAQSDRPVPSDSSAAAPVSHPDPGT